MNNAYLELTYVQVAMAASLILLCIAISYALQLGLETKMAVASLRMIAQLYFLGAILQWVFEVREWYVVVLISLIMPLFAGSAAVQRTSRWYPGIIGNSIGSIWWSSWLITAVTIFGVLRVRPWYEPRYFLPLLGMILGNSLSGISIAVDRLTEELVGKRDQIEARLALGATRWEAARHGVVTAVRTGLIPIINSMMVIGIVNIPGMMTGQLLGGVSPVQAVRYQIVMMFFITSTTTLGTISVVLLGYRRLFNPRHQFLSQLITSPSARRGLFGKLPRLSAGGAR